VSGLGRLALRYLPGGPIGVASRWAVTSNVEVGNTTYPVNRGSVGRAGREGSEGQSHKEEKREEGSGTEELGDLKFGKQKLFYSLFLPQFWTQGTESFWALRGLGDTHSV